MPTENRPVSAHFYTKGNYRGRHEWVATEKAVGFGPHTTVYEPKIDQSSDPLDTGRTMFLQKGGESVVHFPDKTTAHVDRCREQNDGDDRSMIQVDRWRSPTARQAKVETFDPYQTSAKAHFPDPATLPPAPKVANKPYAGGGGFITMNNAMGRVNFVAK